ncbi:hypothetical protein JG559_11065 [Enterococcus faecalis]|uniref:Uncharacterized protein n=1 Tax=Enterococcus faecalis TaxID=1351 RepID=A0A974NYT8_ENTFL|nr:hypothetical protein JG559_11065 [Enterococcus faecalis]
MLLYGRREKGSLHLGKKQIIQALWRRSMKNSYLIVVANPSPDMEEKNIPTE